MKTRKQHEEELIKARTSFGADDRDIIQNIWLDILEHLENIDKNLGGKKRWLN